MGPSLEKYEQYTWSQGHLKILYNSYFYDKYSQTSKCDQLSLATTSH